MAFDLSAPRKPLPVREAPVLPLHAGKKFLVLGAAGGVGEVTADLLVRQGAEIHIADVSAERIKALAARLGCTGGTIDLSDSSSIESGVDAAIAGLGAIDGLVNCGAIAEHFPALETSRDGWRRTFEINVFGTYEAASLVASHMIAAGRRGAIVQIASEAGKRGHSETLLAYSASKAAVINMTRMLSEALAGHDINVNCVCPGSVATPMLRDVARHFSTMIDQTETEIFEAMVSRQLRRHVNPIEVASVMSFLLSDAATAIRGQAINVDGGDTPY
jgi:NAD(P)-dependent dehydrogenase (short-subunit alcohol dehydrogenase family)